MSKTSRSAIVETCSLPSKGLNNLPKTVQMRAMTTMEEKMRLSGSGPSLMPNLIKACITDPEDIDVNSMPLFDITYLMYKLRIVTYGPEYKITLRCPDCGNRFDVVINLDELKCNELPDDFKNPFTIGPLPVSGETIDCRLITSSDNIDIEEEKQRILRKYPDYDGDPTMIIINQKRIVSVDGKTLSKAESKNYVESMHVRDYWYLVDNYNKYVENIGLVTSDLVEYCPKCKYEVVFDLPITSEFFRPRY